MNKLNHLKKSNVRKIGFFGGGFDPIHFGHLHLAIQLKEIYQLDEVLLCPAYCSPLKKKSPPKASPKDRLSMCQEIVEEIPGFSATSVEIDKESSYTVDTIGELKKDSQYQDADFYLMLSDDVLFHITKWKDALTLLSMTYPLIGRRVTPSRAFEQLPKKYALLLERGMTKTAVMEISSTSIRERLSQQLYCGHLVPKKVLDYITTHQLYGAIDATIR